MYIRRRRRRATCGSVTCVWARPARLKTSRSRMWGCWRSWRRSMRAAAPTAAYSRRYFCTSKAGTVGGVGGGVCAPRLLPPHIPAGIFVLVKQVLLEIGGGVCAPRLLPPHIPAGIFVLVKQVLLESWRRSMRAAAPTAAYSRRYFCTSKAGTVRELEEYARRGSYRRIFPQVLWY